jgi:hypothetical protein
MGQQHIGLKVDLIDDAGGIIDSRCARINNQLLVYYTDPVGAYNLRNKQKLSHPNIMGQNKINGTLRLQLNDPYQIQNLSQIKLSVQQTCS